MTTVHLHRHLQLISALQFATLPGTAIMVMKLADLNIRESALGRLKSDEELAISSCLFRMK